MSPRRGDQTDGVVQAMGVSEVHAVDPGDALDRDIRDARRLPEAKHGEDGDLVPRIVAFDVEGGVGFGVALFLRFGERLAEKGYAEPDPTFDIEGYDARYK